MLIMSHRDSKHHFDHSWPVRLQDHQSDVEDHPDGDSGTASTIGTAGIMTKLPAGFHSIDACFYTLANHMDHLGEHLEYRTTRLDNAEEHVSRLEDNRKNTVKQLEKLERILKKK
ncbi:hypothetical protein NDU88_007338 [Pleurodeles waltl]|uniref:Uncharacterized protein n=1 Tax=Pleurodeles waltl TaxID=8319 RepID=A0AAV7QKH4_PLEWA|nr:hypothetical protein NDU88_007338 [Pleurodeles waltl]